MTKESLERLLVDYGVSFTSALADRLLQEFNPGICEDAISRQAIMDIIKQMPNDNPSYWNKCDVINRADTIDEIEDLPSVILSRPTGHWVLSRSDSGARSYQCSLCGHWHPLHDHSLGFRYCNWCGAKMIEPQESEGEDDR